MSQENVNAIRDQYAATNERDFARAMGHYAEDVELVVPPGTMLTTGTFRGHDAVRQWFTDWFTSFQPDYRFDLVDVRDLGNAVLAVAGTEGQGRASGVRVHGEVVWLYSFRDGKIARLELYGTREEAFKALGLQA